MTTEQWQSVYDEFYSFKNQIDSLCDDYHLASDKQKARQIMDAAYYKVRFDSTLLELFNKEGNVNDLRDISQFSFAVIGFLASINKTKKP